PRLLNSMIARHEAEDDEPRSSAERAGHRADGDDGGAALGRDVLVRPGLHYRLADAEAYLLQEPAGKCRNQRRSRGGDGEEDATPQSRHEQHVATPPSLEQAR